MVSSFPPPPILAATRVIATGLDDYRETGTFTFLDLKRGTILNRVPALPPTERLEL